MILASVNRFYLYLLMRSIKVLLLFQRLGMPRRCRLYRLSLTVNKIYGLVGKVSLNYCGAQHSVIFTFVSSLLKLLKTKQLDFPELHGGSSKSVSWKTQDIVFSLDYCCAKFCPKKQFSPYVRYSSSTDLSYKQRTVVGLKLHLHSHIIL